MAQTLEKLDTGKRIFSNAEYLRVTPYEGDVPGTKTYDIVSIVGDTLSITSEDNSVDETPHEFSDNPLVENIKLGKYTLAATCIDFQNKVMQTIFGWEEDGTSKSIFAPTAYKEVFAAIEIGFKNADTIIVAPKVKLSPKPDLGNFKTGQGKGEFGGSCYEQEITIGEVTKSTPLAFIPKEKTYKVKGVDMSLSPVL